jgi:hypothetical protein
MRLCLFPVLLLLLLTWNVSGQLVDPDPDPALNNNMTDSSSYLFEFSLIEGKKYLRAATYSWVQLLYEIALIDVIDCINYSLAVYDDLYDLVEEMINLDFLAAFESVAQAVHKGPVVYR